MKTLQGQVSSLKNQQTATVVISRRWQHPLYKKYVKRSRKYACHYQNLDLAVNDQVVIQESRPISKTKHFVIIKKLEINS